MILNSCLFLSIYLPSQYLCLSVPFCSRCISLYFPLHLCVSPCLSLPACLYALHTHTHILMFPCLCLFSISTPLRSHLCSSCLRHPGKLHFVFNVAEFPACSGRPAGRRGLCTGWLFDLISPGLVFPGKSESSSSPALPKVMSRLEKRK